MNHQLTPSFTSIIHFLSLPFTSIIFFTTSVRHYLCALLPGLLEELLLGLLRCSLQRLTRQGKAPSPGATMKVQRCVEMWWCLAWCLAWCFLMFLLILWINVWWVRCWLILHGFFWCLLLMMFCNILKESTMERTTNRCPPQINLARRSAVSLWPFRVLAVPCGSFILQGRRGHAGPWNPGKSVTSVSVLQTKQVDASRCK